MDMSTSPRPATVLLVEDDARTRDHLARAIASDDRLALVGACGSVAEAKACLGRQLPDVLLTDLGLPDGSGIELIRSTRGEGTRTLAMVITVFGDEDTVVRAIQAGATGYLLKDDTPPSIGDSIVELVEGGSPISAPIARLLLRRVAGAPADGSARAPTAGHPPPAASARGESSASSAPGERPVLTGREHEVLSLVAKGFTFPEIAHLLEVSRHTVTAHVRHIYEKLEVSTRGEAVFEAVQQGLIRISE
jgi:DNA-binding NarL/FixJ family response regulator